MLFCASPALNEFIDGDLRVVWFSSIVTKELSGYDFDTGTVKVMLLVPPMPPSNVPGTLPYGFDGGDGMPIV